MPNGTKSPMIASAAADISSNSGMRTHNAAWPEPCGPGNSHGARPLASLASSRLLMVPSWRFIIGRGGLSAGSGTSGRTAHCATSSSGSMSVVKATQSSPWRGAGIDLMLRRPARATSGGAAARRQPVDILDP